MIRIKFTKLDKADLGITWAKNLKVLFVALQWFGIQIAYGRRPIDLIAWEKKIKTELTELNTRLCPVCHEKVFKDKEARVGDGSRYHRECRPFRYHPERFKPQNA